MLRYFTLGKLVFSYCGDSSWAQWEKAGWSVRIGRHLFAVHHRDYQDRRSGWPKWARFNLSLWRPQ